MSTDDGNANVPNADVQSDLAGSGRRAFLRSAGLTGAALALAGCTIDGPELFAPAQPTRAMVGANGDITLDFSTDIDVLNYA